MEKPILKNNLEAYDWKSYYELHAATPHTPSLEKAVLEYCPPGGEALDIGAGNLRDTKFLLEKGFAVTAVDPSPASTEIGTELNHPALTSVENVIGTWDFPKDHFSLVNAQGILFHFSPARFEPIMNKITGSLREGGVFCGNFLGPKDSWNREGNEKIFVDKEELQKVFKDFDIKMIDEEERDSVSAFSQIRGTNESKHWHIFKVIAVKK